MFSRVTKMPETIPITSATPRARRKAGTSAIVSVLNRVHITTGVNPNTEPTDRSNSPLVISKVIARAIRPSSTVKVNAFDMFVSDMKAGLIDVKTTSMTINRTRGPNSGIATNSFSNPGLSGPPRTAHR